MIQEFGKQFFNAIKEFKKPKPIEEDEGDVFWDSTKIAERRVRESTFFEEKGVVFKEKTYGGKKVIGRDQRINGGAYLTIVGA
jgi:hypothetical protein